MVALLLRSRSRSKINLRDFPSSGSESASLPSLPELPEAVSPEEAPVTSSEEATPEPPAVQPDLFKPGSLLGRLDSGESYDSIRRNPTVIKRRKRSKWKTYLAELGDPNSKQGNFTKGRKGRRSWSGGRRSTSYGSTLEQIREQDSKENLVEEAEGDSPAQEIEVKQLEASAVEAQNIPVVSIEVESEEERAENPVSAGSEKEERATRDRRHWSEPVYIKAETENWLQALWKRQRWSRDAVHELPASNADPPVLPPLTFLDELSTTLARISISAAVDDRFSLDNMSSSRATSPTVVNSRPTSQDDGERTAKISDESPELTELRWLQSVELQIRGRMTMLKDKIAMF